VGLMKRWSIAQVRLKRIVAGQEVMLRARQRWLLLVEGPRLYPASVPAGPVVVGVLRPFH
jgi:hypothetical protein